VSELVSSSKMSSGTAQHRKVMRALKEEDSDRDVFFKKKYKHLIEDNVKDGLYSMEYILEHKLYLPEPPAIADAELRAAGQIKTIAKDTEVFDVKDTKVHQKRNLHRMDKLRKSVGNFLLDDDVLLYNSLKAGERIRLVDETPYFAALSTPRYSQFDFGQKADEQQLGPFAAKISARADELLKLHPPMRSSFRLEPELDKQLDVRKEEKKQIMAQAEENTLRHIYSAELGALTEKAEDLLTKPTYMPKVVVGVPQNPFKTDEPAEPKHPFSKRPPNEKNKKVVRDEEIEELLSEAEAKIAYIKSNPKDFVRKPRSMLVVSGEGEDAKCQWYVERINNRFAAERQGKKLTKFQRNLQSVNRSVNDGAIDYSNKAMFLSLANGLTYEKEDKIHPEAFDRGTKQLVASMSRDRLWTDICDTSKGTLKSAFMDQKIWLEEKEKRDKAAFYEAGIIPGKPQLQQEATAADKVVDDYLKGRIRV